MEKKHSYSELSCFEQCPYKYKLVYIDNHFISCPSIATDFGTLIHHTEEEIGKSLQKGDKPNYNSLILEFDLKMKVLEETYPQEFFELDKSGRSYHEKGDFYKSFSIYRLEKRLNANPNLEIVGLEKEFYLDFNGYTFHGFIDRIFHDKSTDEYIIEDIKTYNKPIEDKDLKVPLQHVIYSLALKSMGIDKIKCTYDLPCCNLIQDVDEGYLEKGTRKLECILDDLKYSDFEPKPTPLCHWCVFSGTYPTQPEEAKGLCPYFSNWTKENKTHTKHYRWLGPKKHPQILEEYQKEINLK